MSRLLSLVAFVWSCVFLVAPTAHAQPVPSAPFRVVGVDAETDAYRLRVGHGVSIRRLIAFANHALPAGASPVTVDDFIAVNQHLAPGRGNLLYVCGHTAHAARTFSHSAQHWALCPDAHRYVALAHTRGTYWLPREHRPNDVDLVRQEMRSHIERGDVVQAADVLRGARVLLGHLSSVYQPGLASLVSLQRDLVEADARAVMPVTAPAQVVPAATPSPAPSRIVRHPHASASPVLEASTAFPVTGWETLVMGMCFLGLAFLSGRASDHRSIRALGALAEQRRRFLQRYQHLCGDLTIDETAVLTRIGESTTFAESMRDAYHQFVRPFLDPDKTEILDDRSKASRMREALAERGILIMTARQHGRELSKEMLEVLLMHPTSEPTPSPPSVVMDADLVAKNGELQGLLEQEQRKNAQYGQATRMLIPVGEPTPAVLFEYASLRNVHTELTPALGMPVGIPADIREELRELEKLRAERRERIASLLPGAQAASTLIEHALPLKRGVNGDLQMQSRRIDKILHDWPSAVTRPHKQGLYKDLVTAWRELTATIQDCFAIDACIMSKLTRSQEGVLSALGDSPLPTVPPPDIRDLMDEILKISQRRSSRLGASTRTRPTQEGGWVDWLEEPPPVPLAPLLPTFGSSAHEVAQTDGPSQEDQFFQTTLTGVGVVTPPPPDAGVPMKQSTSGSGRLHPLGTQTLPPPSLGTDEPAPASSPDLSFSSWTEDEGKHH